MNEFELIARLTKSLRRTKRRDRRGDDCAVLDLGLPDKWLLFKTDAIVEGVHFTKDTPPEKIGRKALAAVSVTSPRWPARPHRAGDHRAAAKVRCEIHRSHLRRQKALAQKLGVAIVGGETTMNPERILISLALLGVVPRAKAVLRSGAKTGDAIFVTGELGGSLAGKHWNLSRAWPRRAGSRKFSLTP